MTTPGLKAFWSMVPEYLDEIVASYEKEIRTILKEKDEIHKQEENQDE